MKKEITKKMIENLQKFATLNNCRKIENKFTNGETTIEYKIYIVDNYND